MKLVRFLKNEKGLTLMELMISMVLITIIGFASFAGLQYAYHILAESREYIEDTYETQAGFEKGLTYVDTSEVSDSASIQSDSNSSRITSDYTIEFTWTTSGIPNFNAIGHVLEKDIDVSYLGNTLYFFVPVHNEDR